MLLERDLELSQMGQLLAAAREGRGSVVVVSGEAGIGKTSLLREFLGRSIADDLVYRGECDDLLTPRALGPFHDIGREVGGELAAALASGDRDAVIDAVLDLMGSRLRTPVLVVEDLQWADEASLDVLAAVARRIGRMAGLVVLTYRDDQVAPDDPLRRLLGGIPTDAVRHIVLRPLSREAVGLMADGRPEVVDRVVAMTGGNPFLVVEALASPDAPVTSTVRDAVLARTRALSDHARQAVRRLAVSPTPLELDVAVRLVGEAALAEVERAGLIGVDGERIAFRHELTRRAVGEALSPMDEIAFNRELLALLDPAKVGPARIVHHAVAARMPDTIVAYAPLAARDAARSGSHREAAIHHRQALDHAGLLSPEDAAAIREELAYELYLLERHEEAVAEARTAAESWSGLGDMNQVGRTLVTLALGLYWADGPREALAAARYAIEVLEPLGETSELALAYVNLAGALSQADEMPSALEWAAKAWELAVRLADPDVEARALGYMGTAWLGMGDAAGAEMLDAADALAVRRRRLEFVVRNAANRVRMAFRHLDLGAIRPLLERGLDVAADNGLEAGTRRLLAESHRLDLMQGRWEDAADGLAELVDPDGPIRMTESLPAAYLGRLQVRQGGTRGRELLEHVLPVARRSGEIERLGPVAVGLVEWAWLNGSEGFEDVAEEALDLAHRTGHRLYQGELLRHLARRGSEAGGDGCPEPFALALAGRTQDAASAWKRLDCPYEQALELSESGDEADLRDALAILHRLGAAPAAAIVRARLKDMGAAAVPRGPRPMTRANPGGLTSRQMDVLRWLPKGLTNAEIAQRLYLSTRTVDHHVAAILRKLQVASRADAVRVAKEMDLI